MLQNHLRIDNDNFIRDSAGRRLCKLLPGNVIEFLHRDRRQSEAVGPPRIGFSELVELLKATEGKNRG